MPGAYKPNSFRVLYPENGGGSSAVKRAPSYEQNLSTNTSNILGQSGSASQAYDGRFYLYGRPAPQRSRPILGNVKTMLYPVSYIATSEADDAWPCCSAKDRKLEMTSHPPPPRHTLDTTFRDDFRDRTTTSGMRVSNGRHTSNPNKTPAVGGVPVTMLPPGDGKERRLTEKLSYEHQYNSRLDPNYPARGKRHGSFVWDEKAAVHDGVQSPKHGHSNNVTAEAGRRMKAGSIGDLMNPALRPPSKKSSPPPRRPYAAREDTTLVAM